MKLIITSDTHYPVDVHRTDSEGNAWFPDDPDIIFIHAGDLMRTGYPDDWDRCKEWLSELPYKIKLYTPGNHDFHLQVYPGPALQELRNIGVKVIGLPGNNNYNSMKLPNGMSLLGLPYVTGLPRWAFNTTEEELENHLHIMGGHDIVISHAPAYGLLDTLTDGTHCGIEAYRKYIDIYNPRVWVSAHIHESYGMTRYKNTNCYNAAMCNRAYKHANPPILIEI